MKIDVFQKLCLKFLVHLLAANDLRLKDARARMGKFAIECNIRMEEMEGYMSKLLEIINDHYVVGKPVPVNDVDERFLGITQEALFYRLAAEGIQFRTFGSVIAKWRSHFKLDPEQSTAFSQTLIHALTDAYIKAKP